MRAISLYQPWATAWVLGIKQFETRHWKTDYRGPIAVHASKLWSYKATEWWARLRAEDDRWPAVPPLGAIVGVVELIDVVPTDRLTGREPGTVGKISELEQSWGNYGPDRYGWIAAAHRALAEPIPWPERQSFFSIPDEVIRAHIART